MAKKAPCIHYWVINPIGSDGLAPGICRHCHEEQDFQGSPPGLASVWRYERWLSQEEAVAYVTAGRYQVMG